MFALAYNPNQRRCDVATKEQIFGILAGASAPMSRVELGAKIGTDYRSFQTQLDRWVKQKTLEDAGDHHYVLTDTGREEALQDEFKEIPGEEMPGASKGEGDETQAAVGKGEKDETQATAGTTEYQQFLRLGKNVGVVPLSLIKVTTEHVWDGGKYEDLKWVAQALQDMGIQRDLANRWLHAWGSHLKQPLPAELPTYFTSPEEKKGESVEVERKKGIGKRAYIIDNTDSPLWVGEGMGNLDYQDAVDISKLRAAARVDRSGSHREGPGEALATKAVEKVIGDMNREPAPPGDETEKVITQFKAIKALLGDGKSESGNDMEKVIAVIKAVREMFPENKPQVTPAQPSTQYLIDKQTGSMQQITPGTPIIIQTSPQNPYIPVQMDKDGNPVVPSNLETWLRLEDFKGEQSRKQESHEVRMELAKSFKDSLTKVGKALANMGEEEK